MYTQTTQTVIKSLGTAALVALLGWSQPSAAQLDPFIGQLAYVAFNFAPRGWANCDGQLFPIAQNTALFSLLGTTYGGNGQTTFALPDMRGRVPIHMGQGPGLSSYTLGQNGGSETHTLLQSELPAHTHTATTTVGAITVTAKASSAVAPTSNPQNAVWANTGRNQSYSTAAPDVNMASGAVVATTPSASTTIGATGGNQPFSIVQPYLTVNCVIALEGIYPSRN